MKRLTILFLILVNTAYANIAEITAVSGKAVIERGKKSIIVKQYTKIEEKDLIKTMKNSKLQIVFKDKTIISLGQKTTFKIDEYLFSEKKSKAKFNVSKGLFKSITGKIGKIAPKNFKLKTQNATIGVRGTTIIGQTSKNGDTIVCSAGQIVVTSPMGEVVVNRGEKTTVKKGLKPTNAVKVSPLVISKIEQKVKTTLTPKTEEKKQPIQKQRHQEVVQDVATVKDQWGDWDKKEIIAQEVQDAPKPVILNPQLQELRDRAGENTPTYSGKVAGFVDEPGRKIQDNNNYINLNIDLGVGKVDGDMGFEVEGEKWSADIKDGTIDKRGQFDFDLENRADSLSGAGDGKLSGEKLENADGVFHLKSEKNNKQIFGTFDARKN